MTDPGFYAAVSSLFDAPGPALLHVEHDGDLV
jgi:hypothetical protein